MKQVPYIGFLSMAFMFCLCSSSSAQPTERPAIWGIAKMTYLVSDFMMARDYYGAFLGFADAFSYPSSKGSVLSFKVNDRQFLECIEDKDARSKARLVSISFETGNVEQMRKFLKEHDVQVPETTSIDGAGNEVIMIHPACHWSSSISMRIRHISSQKGPFCLSGGYRHGFIMPDYFAPV